MKRKRKERKQDIQTNNLNSIVVFKWFYCSFDEFYWYHYEEEEEPICSFFSALRFFFFICVVKWDRENYSDDFLNNVRWSQLMGLSWFICLILRLMGRGRLGSCILGCEFNRSEGTFSTYIYNDRKIKIRSSHIRRWACDTDYRVSYSIFHLSHHIYLYKYIYRRVSVYVCGPYMIWRVYKNFYIQVLGPMSVSESWQGKKKKKLSKIKE